VTFCDPEPVSRPHILLTAPPRTGKTTVIRRLASLLGAAGVPVCGFLSDEVRERGQRVGFVNVPEFERVALPALDRALATRGAVALVDEIGPMELLSPAFLPRCAALFKADIPLVATVHQRSRPALKAHIEAELITVTPENRGSLPETLSRLLTQGL
jgi:nucleoside-triphosphatase